jgi:hypothetical protein
MSRYACSLIFPCIEMTIILTFINGPCTLFRSRDFRYIISAVTRALELEILSTSRSQALHVPTSESLGFSHLERTQPTFPFIKVFRI